MNIIRKWAIARAELYEENGIAWIAEARAGTGTWVIRERDEEGLFIDGRTFEWTNETEPLRGEMILFMTPEERKEMGMSDDIYQRLNFELHVDYDKREKLKLKKGV